MGWSDLVEKYKMNNRFTGKRVGIISASVNASNYQNCLILKYNDDGLYLKTTIFFKLFHPPIFIPWTEVKSVREKKILFTRYNELIIGDPFIATIKLRAKTYRKIQNSHLSSIT
ncbi:hypothetical protein [Aureibacter tunicatorum]|nr:hypothetical protein [Aureibacter tunicatorum]